MVTAMLALVFGAVFIFFSMGARGFQAGISRTGAVGDVQTFTRVFKRDLSLTHYYSVSINERQVATSRGDVSRDGLCLAAISDWNDPDRFQVASGLPKWDRWVLYYANREDLGRLYRVEMERPATSLGNYYPLQPKGNLGVLMIGNPSVLPDILKSSTLCSNVHSLSFRLDHSSQSVVTELTTYTDSSLRMTSQERLEEFNDSKLEIVPLNTYPPL